jgi:hypothetical protein
MDTLSTSDHIDREISRFKYPISSIHNQTNLPAVNAQHPVSSISFVHAPFPALHAAFYLLAAITLALRRCAL